MRRSGGRNRCVHSPISSRPTRDRPCARDVRSGHAADGATGHSKMAEEDAEAETEEEDEPEQEQEEEEEEEETDAVLLAEA